MLVDDVTRQYRADTAEVERRALAEVARSFSGMSVTQVAQTREALVDVAMAMGVTYGDTSALLAAEYFEVLRANALGPGRFQASLSNTLDVDAIRSDMGWAVDPLNKEDPKGALERAQTIVGTLMTRASSDTVRTNVAADTRSSGWYRIARADGCDFCVMLSQRGAVYKRATADFAAHGHCHCTAKPSWDPNAAEVTPRAYEASTRSDKLRALDAADGGNRYERHKASINGWMEYNADNLAAFRSELL